MQYIEPVSTYSGEWVNDEKCGQGVRDLSCLCFVGERQRQGAHHALCHCGLVCRAVLYPPQSFHFDNGDVYEGEWAHDEMHGRGIMRFHNGDIYEGEWRVHVT